MAPSRSRDATIVRSQPVSLQGRCQPLALEAGYTDPYHLFSSLSYLGWLSIRNSGVDDGFHVVRRVEGKKWDVERIERDRLSANFQGDPRWPSECLIEYPRVANLFGLSRNYSDNICIIPDAQTVNRYIRAIFARNAFCFSFDVSPGDTYEDAMVSEKTYVDAYIDRRTLPMSPATSRDAIHDWSFHFFSLLFPEYLENVRLNLIELRKVAQRKAGILVRDWNYYGSTLNAAGQFVSSTVRESTTWEHAVYRQLAVALDVATARPAQLFRLFLKGLGGKLKCEVSKCNIFLDPPTIESLRTMLPFEELDFSTNAAVSMHAKPLDFFEYLKSSLTSLDQSAASVSFSISEGRHRDEIFGGLIDTYSAVC